MLKFLLIPFVAWKRVGLKRCGGRDNRNAYVRWLVILLLLWLPSACSPVLQNTELISMNRDSILFSDDFSKSNTGWGIWNREGAVVEQHNGGMRIRVNLTQYDFWTVAGQHFDDVQIEVDATKIGGPDDNDFGIICRYQDRANFYMLITSSDGYYGIAKLKDGRYSMIGSEQLQYSDRIARGQHVNHLRADCIGSTLRIYANDHLLMEAQDSDFAAGDVGLLAGAYDLKGVDLLFDNFVVKRPDK